MAKAVSRSITNPAREPAERVTPLRVEYTPGNLVKVELETADGEVIQMTMSATALLNLIGMATAAINERTAAFIREVSSPPLAAG